MAKVLKYLLLLSGVIIAAHTEAHPAQASTAFLDIKGATITLETQIPLDQLEMAAPELDLHHIAGITPANRAAIARYLTAHIQIYNSSGEMLSPRAGELQLTQVNDFPYLFASIVFTSAQAIGSFDLRYDAVLHRVVTHKIYLSLRRDFAGAVFPESPKAIDVIHYQHKNIHIDRNQASLWRGFGAMFKTGAQHIAEGVDHLLFLLCLLLPAPLLVNNNRWGAGADAKSSIKRVVKIVTAFTLGHSLTLALTVMGLLNVPSQLIEILVAGSILIAAVHAVRPVFAERAALIAGLFGLVHGCAFASAMAGLGFNAKAIVLALFGFNAGIEAMQLAMIALILPWLLLLCRSRAFIVLRLGGAFFAALAALGWIAERAWQVANPLTPWMDFIAQHGFALYGVFVALAGIITLRGCIKKAMQGLVALNNS